MGLPISEFSDLIVKTVQDNKVTVVVGETGSGKTTQIPIYLYLAGLFGEKMIGVTQPRRIAAISVAEYVAAELGERIGGTVGYKIRFEDEIAENTKIKFMTDGVLLREMQSDPELSKYSVIMIDEAHERGQNIDFALGLLKGLLSRRNDLKVLITSATIDSDKFSKYFWDAPVVNIPGRTYPVNVVYSDKEHDDMNEAIANKIEDIHRNEPKGDVLVFVAGVDDINRVIDLVEHKSLNGVVIFPVHGLLQVEEQRAIFLNYASERKIVVATNIAETSITLDGVVYVIDSGFIKQVNFHPEVGIQSLDLTDHSRSGCDQRKGRAGRTCPGKCFRMYSENNFKERPEFTKPEILRMSLANVVLVMEDMGIKNVRNFNFVDKPDAQAFREAYRKLTALGAINKVGGLTKIGRQMADFPLEPSISRMLLEAEKFGCLEEVSIISAFLSVRNVFSRPRDKEKEADTAHEKFKDSSSDVLTFLNIWKGYQDAGPSRNEWCFENFLNTKSLHEVSKILFQLINILGQNGLSMISKGNPSSKRILKCVAVGLMHNMYRKTGFMGHAYVPIDKELRTEVYVHPSSSTFGHDHRLIVVGKVLQTKKNYAHIVTEVDPSWLPEMMPERCLLGEPELKSFDEEKEIVQATREIIFDGINLGMVNVELDIPTSEKIQAKRIREARENGWVPLSFKKEQGRYITDYLAAYNGSLIKSIDSYMEEGKIHYCEIKPFIGENYAYPKFMVFNFRSKIEKTEEAPKSQIESLLSMYGAKTNRRR